MAIEPRRGCGYRKIGGLYLVNDGEMSPCHLLPFALETCPSCGAGIKQSRGWTWVDWQAVVELAGSPCHVALRLRSQAVLTLDPREVEHCQGCLLCHPALRFRDNTPLDPRDRCGVLWVGKRYYPTPAHFLMEAATLGVSKRLPTMPRDVVPGKTWVWFAHPLGMPLAEIGTNGGEPPAPAPGVILGCYVGLEFMVSRATRESKRAQQLEKRGVRLVELPEGDPDHDPKTPLPKGPQQLELDG